MSFSAHRRDALDKTLPLNYRASHARSCAVHVAEKYKVNRSVVIDLVKERCGVDLMSVNTDEEIALAVEMLSYLKVHGLESKTT